MKRIVLGLLLGCVWFLGNASSLRADVFLGLPLIPESKIVLRTEGRLEMLAPLSHEETERFYGKLLEGEQDILFRDWASATYIEDNRNRPWHSITISKAPENGMTKVVIVKTTFGWLVSALTIRYAAVFVILFFLYLGMIISGAIISRTVTKTDAAKKPG
jgi:hypothetical protein